MTKEQQEIYANLRHYVESGGTAFPYSPEGIEWQYVKHFVDKLLELERGQ